MALRDKAKKAQQSNPIMEGRDKISLETIMANYPEGVTLREVAILHDNSNDSDYVVCVAEEEIKSFFFGGVAFLSLIENILAEYENKDEFYFDLASEGLPVKFSKKRSKNGRIYTAVTVL